MTAAKPLKPRLAVSTGQPPNFTRRDLFAYGVFALPLAFVGLPIYVYAPDFYTTYHGVPLALMGIVLLAIRLLDAFQDPVIGALSDRFHKFRRRFIELALLLLAISFCLLYSPATVAPPLLWFTTCLIAAAFAFSVISINYNALGSLWTDESHEKTSVVAMREGIGLMGLLLATLAPAILKLFVPLTLAYQIYGGLFIVVASSTYLCFRWWAKRHESIEDHFPKSDVKTPTRAFDPRLIIQKPFGPLFLLYGLSTLASSVPGVLVIFFIRDRLMGEKYTGCFLAVYFIAGALGMPLWKVIAKRLGKRQSWRAAMLLALLCFVGAYWLEAGDFIAYGLICFFSGLALGAELILPLSLASDYIDHEQKKSQTSFVFSVLLFMSKLALALASGGALLILSQKGYVPGAAITDKSAHALSLVYALIPSGIKLAAVMLSPLLSDPDRNRELPHAEGA